LNIVCVDDEKLTLSGVMRLCTNSGYADVIHGFRNEEDALEYILNNKVDVALLDINMPGMGGIELGKRIYEGSPATALIYVTGYDNFALDALKVHAFSYLVKPVKQADIDKQFKELTEFLGLSGLKENKPAPEHKFIAKCFGNFESYVDGKPLQFKYSKTKEFLAYLIDREGSMIDNNQIVAVLWEDDDRDHESYLAKLRTDLIDALAIAGIGNVIIRNRGKIGIDVSKVECDYYTWKKKPVNEREPFEGEYMSQYSWAEYTCGRLRDFN